VLHLLLIVVPLGLAAAVSPVMLTEQTVLLAGPQGRRAALLYAGGTAAVLAVVVAAVLMMGRSLSLPRAPHLDAALDLAIGALLLVLAAAVHRWRARSEDTPRRSDRQLSPPAAFGFGIFSMATNVTTLALVVAAAKEVAASHAPAWASVSVAALLVALACLPAWGPLALLRAAPEPADRFLRSLEGLLRRRGRLLVALLLAAGGVFLVARGAVRLAGL
jgi:threonine/homoserine/homoserine lactone efflux protein